MKTPTGGLMHFTRNSLALTMIAFTFISGKSVAATKPADLSQVPKCAGQPFFKRDHAWAPYVAFFGGVAAAATGYFRIAAAKHSLAM